MLTGVGEGANPKWGETSEGADPQQVEASVLARGPVPSHLGARAPPGTGSQDGFVGWPRVPIQQQRDIAEFCACPLQVCLHVLDERGAWGMGGEGCVKRPLSRCPSPPTCPRQELRDSFVSAHGTPCSLPPWDWRPLGGSLSSPSPLPLPHTLCQEGSCTTDHMTLGRHWHTSQEGAPVSTASRKGLRSGFLAARFPPTPVPGEPWSSSMPSTLGLPGAAPCAL